MGAMAEAIAEYARPLLDQTDGSEKELENAFAVSNLCYELAMLPEGGRAGFLRCIQARMRMDRREFAEFRRIVVDPMIRRHREMFPQMHGRLSAARAPFGDTMESGVQTMAPAEKFPGTDRYAPCPCNSGRKYKFCCGAKSR